MAQSATAKATLIRTWLPLSTVLLFASCSSTDIGSSNTDESSGNDEALWFVDEADARGLDFQHESGFDGHYLLPEITAGGAALVDVDNDNDMDAYLIQSGNLLGGSPTSGTHQLFLNDGKGYFELATNPGAAATQSYGMGVTAGDYDNDGDVDLYITNLGPNILLQNDGTGHFTDVTRSAGVGDDGWGTAAAFLDLDLDGFLDLFVVNYLHWNPNTFHDCYSADIQTYCQPAHDNAAADKLYRNNGNGTFTNVSNEAGLKSAFGNGLGLVSADFNQDGLLDVFVANDSMVNQLWLNQGDMRFKEEAYYWGCAMDDHGIAKAGMGVATKDQDNDGDFDILVVNIENQTDSFYRNEGTYFSDATSGIGLGSSSRRYTRFGIAFEDFDNDTFLDLYEANGAVFHEAEDLKRTDPFAEPNSFYRGKVDGRLEPVNVENIAPTTSSHTSRGVAIGDVDNDGGLDLLVMNKDAKPYLLMNQRARENHWVKFSIRNANGHTDLGAVVSGKIGTKRYFRMPQVAGSYLVANDSRIHFGLGQSTDIRDVKVTWSTGIEESFGDYGKGEIIELIEHQGLKPSD